MILCFYSVRRLVANYLTPPGVSTVFSALIFPAVSARDSWLSDAGQTTVMHPLWIVFPPCLLWRFRQALGPKRVAKVHLRHLRKVLRAVPGDKFQGCVVHGTRTALRQLRSELFLQGGQARHKLVPRQD